MALLSYRCVTKLVIIDRSVIIQQRDLRRLQIFKGALQCLIVVCASTFLVLWTAAGQKQ